MFKWLFHILIFATNNGKYQNKEKPLKRQRKLGLYSDMVLASALRYSRPGLNLTRTVGLVFAPCDI